MKNPKITSFLDEGRQRSFCIFQVVESSTKSRKLFGNLFNFPHDVARGGGGGERANHPFSQKNPFSQKG